MDKIFLLVGKTIKELQELEDSLALLVYFYWLPTKADDEADDFSLIREYALSKWVATDQLTLGKKLSAIEPLDCFQEEKDIIVFDYLLEKRNYLVHRFFVDNTFDSDVEIKNRKDELNEIFSLSRILNSALKKIVQDSSKQYNL